MAMMATTTRSSMSVKLGRRRVMARSPRFTTKDTKGTKKEMQFSRHEDS